MFIWNNYKHNISMPILVLCMLIIAGINTAKAQMQANPFNDAAIVWHMSTPTASENYPLDLEVCRQAHLGEKLTGNDYSESIKRGGDGFVAVLDSGWLCLNQHRARKFRPVNNAISLYMRTWVGANGAGSLFFSDFMALALDPSGLAIGFLGNCTSTGKVFRELPLGYIKRGQWLDFVIRIGNGLIDFYCNGELINSIPLRHALASPFDDDLLIGAFKCAKPDLYGTATPSAFPHCKIDAVALWNYALSDSQIAFLSGVSGLTKQAAKNELTQAFLNYNAFFDASVNKDLKACGVLWDSLREVGNKDPFRPVYHLTQPLGYIFDPVGAFFYGGKYHVFSYRNIFSLLNYSSLDHYVSDDLLHWTEWPVAPFADNSLDVFGIYLMNHFIDDKGTPRVLYTGQGTEGKFGVLAQSDDSLVSYTGKKAVLTKYHHDGHVWKDGNTWFTITSRMYKGKRSGNRGDAVMLWSSSNLENWQERGEIFTHPKDIHSLNSGDRTGFMEFPYLLPFGDKDVLILGGHPVRYWVGRFDRQHLKFVPDHPNGLLLDYSNPFHCDNPLCVDQKGPGGSARRIIMAMYSGISGNAPGQLPWSFVHAMPRSLNLEGGHLRQDPLPEMQSLRGDHYSESNVIMSPGKSGFVSKRGDCLEIIAEFQPRDARRFGLKVRLSNDGNSFIRIFFDTTTGEFGVDGRVVKGSGPSYIPKGQPVRMHVFLDKLLVEAFVNGMTCTTSAADKDLHFDGIDMFTEGGSARCINLDIWNLERK